MFPRRAIDPARQRIGLIAADDQAALLFAHVDQVVRIAQAGRLVRELTARPRP